MLEKKSPIFLLIFSVSSSVYVFIELGNGSSPRPLFSHAHSKAWLNVSKAIKTIKRNLLIKIPPYFYFNVIFHLTSPPTSLF